MNESSPSPDRGDRRQDADAEVHLSSASAQGVPGVAPDYPAAFTVHWPAGPVPACVKHARALIGLGRVMGMHVPATAPEEGAQCTNCINEARRSNV
jgi:hypothetical protein